jgi:hypothetical protein
MNDRCRRWSTTSAFGRPETKGERQRSTLKRQSERRNTHANAVFSCADGPADISSWPGFASGPRLDCRPLDGASEYREPAIAEHASTHVSAGM